MKLALLAIFFWVSIASAQQPTLAPEVRPSPTPVQIHAMSMEQRWAYEDRLYADIDKGLGNLGRSIDAKDAQIRDLQRQVAILQRKLDQANEQLTRLTQPKPER